MIYNLNKDIIISDTKKPCVICGKETNHIDIYSEQYFCSESCLDKFYVKWNEVLNNMLNSDVAL